MATVTLKIGNEEKEVPLGVTALMVYEQQFKSDLVQDLFGLAVVRKANNDDDIEFSVDYRNTNWTAVVKATWAILKAADGNTEAFDVWSEKLETVNLNELAQAVLPAAFEAFFQVGDSNSKKGSKK